MGGVREYEIRLVLFLVSCPARPALFYDRGGFPFFGVWSSVVIFQETYRAMDLGLLGYNHWILILYPSRFYPGRNSGTPVPLIYAGVCLA